MDDQVAAPRPEVGARSEGLGLHRGVLSSLQIFFQSVAGIGPTVGAVALIPLVFSVAGYSAWLTVVLATIGILGVGVCVSELAKRYVSPGALYNFVPQGLGASLGLITGGTVILMSVVAGPFLVIGIGQSASEFLSAVGLVNLSTGGVFALEVVALGIVTLIAYLEIRLSTRLLLIFELTSMTFIMILLVVILARHPGGPIDTRQFRLEGANLHGTLLAVVYMVLAFGAFESSASLSVEAKNPRRAVPVAVIWSVVFIGVFFVINAYVQVLGFEGLKTSLATQTAPLETLSHSVGAAWLGDIALLGVTISFFACTNAWLNYGSRCVFTMAHDKVLPRQLARAHPRHGSPYVSVLSLSIVWFAVLAYIYFGKVNATNSFADLGALDGYCFTIVYFLVALAAPVYMLRRHMLTARIALAGAIGMLVMVLEFFYSFHPLPIGSLRDFVIGFAAFEVALVVACIVARLAAPQWVARVGKTQDSSSDAQEVA